MLPARLMLAYPFLESHLCSGDIKSELQWPHCEEQHGADTGIDFNMGTLGAADRCLDLKSFFSFLIPFKKAKNVCAFTFFVITDGLI